MKLRPRPSLASTVICGVLAAVVLAAVAAAEAPSVSGSLVANGTTIELPYVYAWALEEGFYDPADPTWRLLFVEHPVEERELDGVIWDSAYVELGITLSSEFGDEPELQVYSQSLRLSADGGGNISGGTYPELELESTGPERFAGRVHLPEPQEFFDDTFQYDFTFSTPLSNPNAPIGEPLPAGGGEAGEAYLAWVAALHAGDIERLRSLVPPDMAAQLDGDEVAEQIAFMAALTPTDVKVLGGSSDGQTAILEVEGMLEGEPVHGEVTLERMAGVWVSTRSSW